MQELNISYTILTEFEFLVDMDLAMFKYLKDNAAGSPMLDERIFNMTNEKEVIFTLLNRKHINPLEILIPEGDTLNLYKDLMANHEEELLEYATVYDTFKLMITFLNNISAPTSITVLCKNDLEADFIKKCNDRLGTRVVKNKQAMSLARYNVIYVKYLIQLVEFQRKQLNGKHLYFAATKFNMEEDKDCVKGALSYMFSDTNILHMIDLYKKVKYRFRKEEKK